MLPLLACREASPGVGAPAYVRHRPEYTFLYQLVQEYYPALKRYLAKQGWGLPGVILASARFHFLDDALKVGARNEVADLVNMLHDAFTLGLLRSDAGGFGDSPTPYTLG